MNKLTLLLLIIVVGFLGCAKFWDGVSAKGGLIGSSKAPYIIINHSGGQIMDVYKLTNAIVQSPEGSDGWLFLDNTGNPVYLGGDIKTIRLKNTNSSMWSKYKEYHMENEILSYRDLYNSSGTVYVP